MPKTAEPPTTATPARWRKRRLVIEAIHYDGTPDSFTTIATWSNGGVRHDPNSGARRLVPRGTALLELR